MPTPRFAHLALAAILATACADAAGPARSDIPDREAFVATYVGLRAAALGAEGRELTDALRAEVLEANGVTEEQLYAFVEHYGENLPFMRDVWNDVEARLEAQRAGTDPVPISGPPEPGRN